MIEVVEFFVRPKNQDKKLHVFRIVSDSEKTDFSSVRNVFLKKMSDIFPFGFYLNKVNRHVIDYVAYDYTSGVCELTESCTHEYLSIYLNSDDYKVS